MGVADKTDAQNQREIFNYPLFFFKTFDYRFVFFMNHISVKIPKISKHSLIFFV